MKKEMTTIETAFSIEISKLDGVNYTGLGSASFLYSGSDDKVAAACENAKKALANEVFVGKYIYKVTRIDNDKTISSFEVNMLK